MIKHNKFTSCLTLHDLELCLHLGWPENERLKEQTVSVDIEIFFPNPPKACVSDKLEDTFCYSALVKKIREALCHRHFHLIEYLAKELYDVIITAVPNENDVYIQITKKPNIPGLKGGVTFTYTNRD